MSESCSFSPLCPLPEDHWGACDDFGLDWWLDQYETPLDWLPEL